uniref:Uncharacterized protein n=1 Tax=Cacopsylla melanoneura TaxID=428564 RepID=A0A8D8RHN0_9HEMI
MFRTKSLKKGHENVSFLCPEVLHLTQKLSLVQSFAKCPDPAHFRHLASVTLVSRQCLAEWPIWRQLMHLSTSIFSRSLQEVQPILIALACNSVSPSVLGTVAVAIKNPELVGLGLSTLILSSS